MFYLASLYSGRGGGVGLRKHLSDSPAEETILVIGSAAGFPD